MQANIRMYSLFNVFVFVAVAVADIVCGKHSVKLQQTRRSGKTIKI